MTKHEFTIKLFEHFEADSHAQYGPNRMFTPAERTAFLLHIQGLWDEAAVDVGPIDMHSAAAVAAMLRAQKYSDSMQEQLVLFQRYYVEEVKRFPKKH